MGKKKADSIKAKLEKKLAPFYSRLGCSSKKKKKRWLVVGIVLLLLALGYQFRGQLVAAVVNGRPISRLALVRELEKQAGKRVLEAMVTEALIFQEAENQGVRVSGEEIEARMKQLEETLAGQGQDLNQLLSLQGGTREELEEQVRLQVMIEKMAGKEIEVADEEVDDYFEENKDSFSEDLETEEVRAQIKEQLRRQKLTLETQSWLQSLREKAEIDYLLEF